MGLGLRPPMMGGPPTPMGGYGPPGQGPPLSALGQHGLPVQPISYNGPKLTAFVGSISAGITDTFLTQLLSVCTLSPKLDNTFLTRTPSDMWTSTVFQEDTNSNGKTWCLWFR